jgi:hypothetical protein
MSRGLPRGGFIWYNFNVKMIKANQIPAYFKPLLWSYDFDKIDPQKNERDIVLNAINYGDLIHWSWILKRYGKTGVGRVVAQSRSTRLRPGARRLIMIILGQSDA